MIRRGAVALTIALAVAAPASAAQRTVRSGPLRAVITTNPWHLDFVQPRGATLSESRGTGPGPTGSLGFESNARTPWVLLLR